MYKFFIAFCTLFLFSSMAFGQDYAFSPPPTSGKQKPPKLTVPSPRTPATPGDFKKQVKTLNQKSQSDLNQQAAQQNKMMKSVTAPITSTTPDTPKPAKPTVIQPPPAKEETEQNGTTTSPPPPVRPSDNYPGSDQPPPPDLNPNVQQSNPDVYTGFPSAPNNNAQQPTQQPQSNEGGWLNY